MNPTTTNIQTKTECDLTQLDICLAKCTNPLNAITEELIDELCVVINNQTNGPYQTLKFLSYKTQSPQEIEALHSLKVLEMLVERGGYKIVNEIGKFRFLNEIIKIVSPKYLANQTSNRVKNRVIELIFQWSMDFKELPKLFEAYQMLKVQKIVIDDPIHVLKDYRPPTPPKPRPKDEIFDDEQTVKTLRSLIESGKTENLDAANKLIKNLANKAETRNQFKTNFSNEIESAKNCCQLLNEMVAQCNENLKVDYEKNQILYKGTTDEDIQLMKDLLNACKSARFRLFRFSNQITDNDEQEMKQLIDVSDMLMFSINNCKRYFMFLDDPKSLKKTIKSNSNTDSMNDIENDDDNNEERLLDLNTSPESMSPKNFQMKNLEKNLNELQINNDDDGINNNHHHELLKDFLTNPNATQNSSTNNPQMSNTNSKTNNLNELNEMFAHHHQQQRQNSSDFRESIETTTNLCSVLSNINITYEDIKPCREMKPPLLVYNQNGLMINLHFTDNRPHPKISVFLLTFTNYNSNPISKINFLVAVPKRMKVKLLYQTGTTLPGLPNGKNLPQKFISQIMLIGFDKTDSIHEQSSSSSNTTMTNTSPINENMIEFKLKYKLSYLLQNKLNEHCSQFVWNYKLEQNNQNINQTENNTINDNKCTNYSLTKT